MLLNLYGYINIHVTGHNVVYVFMNFYFLYLVLNSTKFSCKVLFLSSPIAAFGKEGAGSIAFCYICFI